MIIDYGMGNLRSVQRSIQSVYPDVIISSNPKVIEESRAIVLPGVGAFGDAMEELYHRGLIEVIKDQIIKNPTLGICLGMQILFENSEESPALKGLGLLKGKVKSLKNVKNISSIRIPHTGWNKLISKISNSIFQGYVYFNHTYYCQPQDAKIVMAEVLHGIRIPAIIQKNNLFATQFHPEKSKNVGAELIQWWLNKIIDLENNK